MSDFSQYSGRIRVRASALVIHTNSILLVHQKVPVRTGPVWIPPGGGIETGEEAETALVREVKEETGLEIAPVSLRYVHEFIHPPFHAVELYFMAEMRGGILKTGSDPEHSAADQLIKSVNWVNLDHVHDIDLFPEFLRQQAISGTIAENRINHFRSVHRPMNS